MYISRIVLNRIINYIRLIRPVNLAIIAITQLFVYYSIIKINFVTASLETTLSPPLVFIFVGVTLLLAAGSYVINDIFDCTEDQINKEKKSLTYRQINIKNAKIYYYLLTAAGFIMALVIAINISKLHLVIIYPIVVFLLYQYSAKWKKQGLKGNLTVAGFCAFVIAVFLVAEPLLIYNTHPSAKLAYHTILALSLFAFIINLCREMIKDIEDIEGDKVAQSNSLPITIGISRTKAFTKILIYMLIVLILLWLYYMRYRSDFFLNTFAFLFLIAPLGVCLTKITQAREKIEYSFISRFLKLIMLSGLIFFYISTQIENNGNF